VVSRGERIRNEVKMDSNKLQDPTSSATEAERANIGRRELLERLGKFGMYALPFTVLAFTAKPAAAASCAKGFGSCGGGGPTTAGPRH
jgi:hypothetical protein